MQQNLFTTAIFALLASSALSTDEVDPNCVISVDDGSTLTMHYNPSTEQVEMISNVKIGTYLGLYWGATLQNTELIVWSAQSGEWAAQGTFKTYMSKGNEMPKVDIGAQGCYYS